MASVSAGFASKSVAFASSRPVLIRYWPIYILASITSWWAFIMALICSKIATAQSSGSMMTLHVNHNPVMHISIHSNNLVNPIPLLTPAVM
jgi:hypothetical protein